MAVTYEESEIKELRECLEVLLAIELLEYHNRTFLDDSLNKSPKKLNEEKRELICRGISIIKFSNERIY